VKDHPIIFSGPMVRALLGGRKTQTRRLWASPLRRVEPGDRLWVREAWACHWATDDQPPRDIDPVVWSVRYEADGHIRASSAPDGSKALDNQFKRIRPSIHMPRWASRLTLVVTEVRFQWLQAMIREDCSAEGHPRATDVATAAYPEEVHLDAARDWYMDLWDSLHPKQPWSTNPRVVALTFTVERTCPAKA
jgi:hypothetical protein